MSKKLSAEAVAFLETFGSRNGTVPLGIADQLPEAWVQRTFHQHRTWEDFEADETIPAFARSMLPRSKEAFDRRNLIMLTDKGYAASQRYAKKGQARQKVERDERAKRRDVGERALAGGRPKPKGAPRA